MSNFFSFLGDSDLDALNREVDNIINTMPDLSPSIEVTTDTDASTIVRDLLSGSDKFSNKEQAKKNPLFSQDENTENSGIMNEITTLIDKLAIQPERSGRYKTYEELYQGVPIIKKMLKVWISNLIQKNPVTGKSIMLKDSEENNLANQQDEFFKNKKRAAEAFIDETINYFDIVQKLKYRIIPNQQMYGDSFVELINLNNYDMFKDDEMDMFLGESVIHNKHIKNKKNGSRSKKILTENEILENVNSKILYKENLGNNEVDNLCEQLADIFIDYKSFDELTGEMDSRHLSGQPTIIDLNENFKSKNVEHINSYYDYAANSAGKMNPELKINIIKEEESDEQIDQKVLFQDANIKTKIDLSNILMLIHHPKNILILESGYGTKLGYVEIADKENIQVTNIGQKLLPN